MDIYIGIDKQEVDKFKPVAVAIANRIEKENIANTKNIKEYNKSANDICMLFSNSIKYIEDFAKDSPCEIINVTDNLSSSHIVAALKYVKDIYYLKADSNTLMDKLLTRVRFVENREKVKK